MADRARTKRLDVIVSSETIVDIVHATCDEEHLCLIRSHWPLAGIGGAVSAPNLRPYHLDARNTTVYIIPRDTLTDRNAEFHELAMEQVSARYGMFYHDMMNIGAIHLPVSFESVHAISLSYRAIKFREPYVVRSGMQEVALAMRKRFLEQTRLKAVVRVYGGQDWPTEIYRCEPALRERVQGRDDFLHFAN